MHWFQISTLELSKPNPGILNICSQHVSGASRWSPPWPQYPILVPLRCFTCRNNTFHGEDNTLQHLTNTQSSPDLFHHAVPSAPLIKVLCTTGTFSNTKAWTAHLSSKSLCSFFTICMDGVTAKKEMQLLQKMQKHIQVCTLCFYQLYSDVYKNIVKFPH